MSGKFYAGVFVERERIRTIVVKHLGDDRINGLDRPRLDVVTSAPFLGASLSVMADAASWISSQPLAISGIGIASYGPFSSLDPSDAGKDYVSGNYGQLFPRTSALPYRGVSLPELFSRPFREMGRGVPPILVDTDASAGAIGEAWLAGIAGNDRRSVTAYLMLTDSIGGGYSAGLNVIRGGHHSELGLIDIPVLSEDPLARSGLLTGTCYLGRIASATMMVKRAESAGHEVSSIEEVYDIQNPAIWGVWSRYVAIACLTCTAVLSPKKIILGGPMTQGYRVLKSVRLAFDELWHARSGGPTFEYPDLTAEGFINLSRAENDIESDLLGAACLALSARYPAWDQLRVTKLSRVKT